MGQIGTLYTFAPNTIIRSAYMNSNINDIKTTYNEHDTATTGVHGLSGNVVGTSDSQTLTNKTLTSPTLNGGTLNSMSEMTCDHYSATRKVLTDGATIAIDWDNGNVQYVELGAAGRTVTFANPKTGGRYIFIIKQDGTGSRTITTWPTIVWVGGAAPTLTTTADHYDIVSLVYDGTNYYGAYTLDFS